MRIVLLFILVIFDSFSSVASVDDLVLQSHWDEGIALFEQSNYSAAWPLFLDLSENASEPTKIRAQIYLLHLFNIYGAPHWVIQQSEILASELLSSKSPHWEQLNQLAKLKAEAHLQLLQMEAYRVETKKAIAYKRNYTQHQADFAEEWHFEARYFLELDQKDSVFYYANKALLLARNQHDVYLEAKVLCTIGYNYHPHGVKHGGDNSKEFKLSRAYYDSALAIIFNKQAHVDSLTLAKIYHRLGNSFNNEAKASLNPTSYQKSLSYYDRSLKILQNYGNVNELTLNDFTRSFAHRRLNKGNEAIQANHHGLQRLIPNSSFSLLEPPPISESINDLRLLGFAGFQGNSFYEAAYQTQRLDYLKACIEYFEYSFQLNQHWLSMANHEEEVILYGWLYHSNYYEMHAFALLKKFELDQDSVYLKTHYDWLARSKYAYVHRVPMSETDRKAHQQWLLQEEFNRLLENLASLGVLNSEIASGLDKFLGFKKKENPSKISSNYLGNYDVNLASIQGYLKQQKAAMLDLFYYNDTLALFYADHNQLKTAKQVLNKEDRERMQQFKNRLLSLSAEEYAQESNYWYRKFIAPVRAWIGTDIQTLIICSSRGFPEIPWDALVDRVEPVQSFKELNFWAQNISIRTVLSPQQLLQAAPHKVPYQISSIKPEFDQSKRFAPLWFTSEMLGKKAHRFIYSKEIDPNDFKSGIVILSGHVSNHTDKVRDSHAGDAKKSSLFFSDTDSISIWNAHHWQVKADLVIVSGCSSGMGSNFGSEGTISFTRAFYQSGTKAILYALWDIDDAASAHLIELFLMHLEKGIPAEQALFQAKRQFVEDPPNEAWSHPYYWAGLHLNGHNVQFESEAEYRYFIWIPLPLLFLFVLIQIFVRNRRLSNRKDAALAKL